MTLSFADGTNLDNATSDVRDATSRLINRFPDGAEAPVIIKADPDAQAILQLGVTSDTLDRAELTTLVNDVIAERLASVHGVADVQVYGTQSQIFEIDVDQVKLASLGLTVGDIRNALATISFDSPAGSINGANQNINVRAISEVTTPEQFEDIIINGKTRLRDVATVIFARELVGVGPSLRRQVGHRHRHRPPGAVQHGLDLGRHPRGRRRHAGQPARRSRASRSRLTMPPSSAARCTRSSAR